MDAIRDLINSIGLQPEHFDYLIIAIVIVGGAAALYRLYTDLTRPVGELYQEEQNK